jgi:Beta-propeller repeat
MKYTTINQFRQRSARAFAQDLVVALFIGAGMLPNLAFAQDLSVAWGQQVGTVEDDHSFDVAADVNGVYMTGTTRGSLGGPNPGVGIGGNTQDAFLLRYDRNGNRVWGRQFGDVNSDSASDVAVSPTGGAYITGSTGSHLAGQNAGGTDLFLARYDAAGELLWTRQLGTSLNDSGLGVSADALGNVFVGGLTFGELAADNSGINRSDAILSRYDQNGNLIWTRQWGQEDTDSANAVVADGQGGVFVTGPTRTFSASNQTGFDAFVRRYDVEGNLLWTRMLTTNFGDSTHGIALDGHGGIYVSGDTQGSLAGSNPTPLTGDPFLARFDASGNLLWVRQINSPGVDDGTQVTADGRGGVFITGSVIQSLPGHTQQGLGDAFVAYYTESGELVSTAQFGSEKADVGNGISADGLGNVYVSGSTWGAMFGDNRGGPYDAFVARLAVVPEPPSLVLILLSALVMCQGRSRHSIAASIFDVGRRVGANPTGECSLASP